MRGQLSNRMASVLATQACGEQFERLETKIATLLLSRMANVLSTSDEVTRGQ
ncbi:hypothetical protein HMPREF9999_01366 [Alloprevotella sp. oral taxon 473 str. F0040]|nr:hypothetical protein HMPREF9999_01366 [Alloprevotella sp. oral taxon 473 str. F0040]